ncbi:MFS transporter [soil metagenome]
MLRLPANFQRLLTAQAISNVGDGVTLVAMPLLATHYTREPVLVAGAAVAQGLPWLFFSLHAGVVVDRLDRRQLMIAADTLRFVVLFLFGIVVLTDFGGIALLYIVAFILSTAETVYGSAAQSIIPQVVGGDDKALDTANGRIEATAVSGQEFIGPALGGLLFAAALSMPFLLDSLTFAASALLLLRMQGRFSAVPSSTIAASPRRSILREITEGIRWIRRDPVLLLTTALIGFASFFHGSVWALLVLFARDILLVSPAVFGLLWGIGAAGDLLGSLATGRLRRLLGAGRAITAAVAFTGVGYLIIGLSSNVVLFSVGLAVSGFSMVTGSIVLVSLRQRLTPDRLLGRVSSAIRLSIRGLAPLGALFGGLVAHHFGGVRTPFLFAGVMTLAAAVVTGPTLLRRLAAVGAKARPQ